MREWSRVVSLVVAVPLVAASGVLIFLAPSALLAAGLTSVGLGVAAFIWNPQEEEAFPDLWIDVAHAALFLGLVLTGLLLIGLSFLI